MWHALRVGEPRGERGASSRGCGGVPGAVQPGHARQPQQAQARRPGAPPMIPDTRHSTPNACTL